MQEQLNRIWSAGVLPCAAALPGGDAANLARAIADGGMAAMAVGMSSDDAAETVRTATESCPDMAIGVSGAVTPAQCRAALDAGAGFVLDTGFDAEILELCRGAKAAYLPACVTPHEVTLAYRQGLRAVRFFPADCFGSVVSVQAMRKAFPDVRFLVGGGVTPETLTAYMRCPGVLAACGDWLGLDGLAAEGDWAGVTAACKKAVLLAQGFEMYHVGINSENADLARETAAMFGDAFGFPSAEGPFAVYSSRALRALDSTLYDHGMQPVSTELGKFYYTADFEIMKTPARGAKGHIGIRANSIERAIVYLQKQGFRVDPDSTFYADDRIFTVYLDDQHVFGGFAVHLLQF